MSKRQELYRIPIQDGIELSVERTPGCGELNQFHVSLCRKLKIGKDFSMGHGCSHAPTFEVLKAHVERNLPDFMSMTEEQIIRLCTSDQWKSASEVEK